MKEVDQVSCFSHVSGRVPKVVCNQLSIRCEEELVEPILRNVREIDRQQI